MSIIHFAVLILLAAVWGASFMFLRIAAPEFGPFALIEIRVVLASAFLLPIWYFREYHKSISVVRERWRQLLVIGALNSAAPFTLFAYATLFVTGGLASILNSTAPIWGAVVAFIWLRKSLAWDGVLGLFLGLGGVVILVSGSLASGFEQAAPGIVAGIVGAVLYGIAANYVGEKGAGISPLTIATFSLVAASVILLPFALLSYPTTPISSLAWMSVLAMGIFSTALANILYFYLLDAIGATKSITVAYLIPVFGTAWGAIFIDEQITLQMVVGAGIILLGTSLVTGVLSLRRKSDA